MIFYTLRGPRHELEIFEDKIRLIKKPLIKLFSRKKEVHSWNIQDLSQFEITAKKMMMASGQLQWQTFNGETGTFRFTTSPEMVKKIETYLQKKVIKNHQKVNQIKTLPPQREREMAA